MAFLGGETRARCQLYYHHCKIEVNEQLVCTKTYRFTHQLRRLVYFINQAVSQEDAAVRKKLKLIIKFIKENDNSRLKEMDNLG